MTNGMMMPGMMWAMGLFGLLVIVVLVLTAAALIKYLLSGRKVGILVLFAIASLSPALAEQGDAAREEGETA